MACVEVSKRPIELMTPSPVSMRSSASRSLLRRGAKLADFLLARRVVASMPS